ncbi:MBL fold metallo-hydrolase [Ligilactobacillus salivarius]
MKVSFIGTTMLLFDDGIDQILVDGYVTRPAITRTFTTKLSTDKQVADRVLKDFKMDRVRGIFVSHSHYDHVMDVPYFAVKCNADVYGSQSTLNVARGGGVKENVIHSFDDSLEYEIGNFKIKVFHSKHSKPTAINNDLGQTIDYPLHQPTKMHGYVEGGSFDF